MNSFAYPRATYANITLGDDRVFVAGHEVGRIKGSRFFRLDEDANAKGERFNSSHGYLFDALAAAINASYARAS
jgi:hypothetical protein